MKKAVQVPTSEETARFYDAVMSGTETRGVLGKEARFDPLSIAQMPSVDRFFTGVVRPYLTGLPRVLDFGCGPGTFAIPVASMAKEVIAVDISRAFVDTANEAFAALGLGNARALQIPPSGLPFRDGSFDATVMMDVIHHLETPAETLKEVVRVLKPGGLFIAFEPNNLNPMVTLLHTLDRNEWGIFQLGMPGRYRRLLSPLLDIEDIQYNGIVIGPKSPAIHGISAFLNRPLLYRVLGWLNPKMVIVARKRLS
jgi:SAM-dependent methyltransferase